MEFQTCKLEQEIRIRKAKTDMNDLCIMRGLHLQLCTNAQRCCPSCSSCATALQVSPSASRRHCKVDCPQWLTSEAGRLCTSRAQWCQAVVVLRGLRPSGSCALVFSILISVLARVFGQFVALPLGLASQGQISELGDTREVEFHVSAPL